MYEEGGYGGEIPLDNDLAESFDESKFKVPSSERPM
jgi:hypothetical protein